MTDAELAAQVDLALRDVPDPETGINIVDMGLVCAIVADAATQSVTLTVTFTTPACPAGAAILAGIERRLKRVAGIESVDLQLSFEPPWTPERISEAGRTELGWEPPESKADAWRMPGTR